MSHRFKCTHRRLHRGFYCSHIPVWLVHFGRKLGVAILLSFQRLSEMVEITLYFGTLYFPVSNFLVILFETRPK
jgi:hypothetical protein